MRLVTFDPFRALGIPGARYIKPELYRDHEVLIREADWVLFPEYWQVNTLSYVWRCRLFPSLASYHLGHDKIEMTRAMEAGWPNNVPRTLIAASTPENAQRILEALGLPLVAKVVRSSQGRGVRRIDDEADWLAWCAREPILYAQELLDIDRDLRLVVIGRDVVAGYWRVAPEGGFLNNVAAGGAIDPAPVPGAARRLVTAMARRLRIDHAGFDVAMVGGRPMVLEFNRLFGNHGLREQGVNPGALIHQHLQSRTGNGRPRRDGGGRRRAA
ncbi:MAG: ATP-grasp domain-containing protein [bacterium]